MNAPILYQIFQIYLMKGEEFAFFCLFQIPKLKIYEEPKNILKEEHFIEMRPNKALFHSIFFTLLEVPSS